MLELKQIYSGIVKNASLKLADSGCLALSGPSGSGKTTLLNVIAGNRPYYGEVFYQGASIDNIAPWKRGFRYLNQRLYLFPHLSVDGNLALAQYAAGKKRDKAERQKLLAEFGIERLASRKPCFISGGEQQRAALARSLIGNPKLLLLDEPFSNLDNELKARLWSKIVKIKKIIPVILVSHDTNEISALADALVYMKDGELKDAVKENQKNNRTPLIAAS
ncbi:MAG: ATP-binding cassette domain-containing protein [Spirochaetaceae bacterium]|jgi:molybdate transport system ATP-binding protein|nr:ATP-binding cassette domain-containing protein [Spirochaetaceae bacterium]